MFVYVFTEESLQGLMMDRWFNANDELHRYMFWCFTTAIAIFIFSGVVFH